MEFRIPRMEFFQFRELLREYPGTLSELREWPFHSESVFPEIGVVPRLLNFGSLLFLLLEGRGRGRPGRQGGWGRFFNESPRRRGALLREGGGAEVRGF